jgi:hypothetical protein
MPASAKWKAIAYGNGKFVVISESSPGAYSTDGINWTAMTMPAGTWRGVAYGGGKFIAANANLAGAYSFDGINWLSGTMLEKNWQVIAYGDGRFVAIAGRIGGNNPPNDVLATSTDGSNWTIVMELSTPFWTFLGYGDGKFVAAVLGMLVVFTTDGVDWTETTAKTESETPLIAAEVAYGDGVFVSVSTDSAGRSTDGINWSAMTMPAGDWRAIAYGDGKFVAIASGSNLAACLIT